MRSIFTRIVWVVFFVTFLIFSCKKTETDPTSNAVNKSEIYAGQDRVVIVPDGWRAGLFGSVVSGTMNEMNAVWRKVAGDTVIMGGSNGFRGEAWISFPGVYQFELSVTDRQGSVMKDTVRITAVLASDCKANRQVVTAEYVEVARHSSAFIADFSSNGFYLSAARSSSKVFFAGGIYNPINIGQLWYAKVMIRYEMESKTIKEYPMSVERANLTVAANDFQVLFAGGLINGEPTDLVEIFDQETEKFNQSKLKIARSEMAGVAAGNKFFFAGGLEVGEKYSNVVEIYDMSTKAWSISHLSHPRKGMSALVVGSKVYFSGGEGRGSTQSKMIDIYDLPTGQWSTSEMAIPRYPVESVALGSSIFYAGGSYSFDGSAISRVEFYNTSTGTSAIQCLAGHSYPSPHDNNMRVTTDGNKSLYYLSNDLINKYDVDKDSWASALGGFTGLFTYKNEIFAVAFQDSNMIIFKVNM